jgi:hypothetical protein
MAVGGEVVDFGRLNLLDDADQAGAVGEVAMMELVADVGLVEVAVEMVNPSGIEGLGAPLDAVNDVALVE